MTVREAKHVVIFFKRCFFISFFNLYITEYCLDLFEKRCGLETLSLEYHQNRLLNRKTGVEMFRVFIHGVFALKNFAK